MPSDGTVRSGSRLNQVILLRLDPDTLSPETRDASGGRRRRLHRRSARTPAATSTTGSRTERLLACQCHFSQFDPRDGAKVVDGPAPRPLPALPLKIVDGKLVVAQPFTAPIGVRERLT